MKDQLIAMVAEKTGLSQDMAKTATETVLSFLKDKLPAPVAGGIDSLLGGEGASGMTDGLADKAGSMLGNMFGSKG